MEHFKELLSFFIQRTSDVPFFQKEFFPYIELFQYITNAIRTFFLAKLVGVKVCQSQQDHEEIHSKQVFLYETLSTFLLIHFGALKHALTYSSIMADTQFAGSTVLLHELYTCLCV